MFANSGLLTMARKLTFRLVPLRSQCSLVRLKINTFATSIKPHHNVSLLNSAIKTLDLSILIDSTLPFYVLWRHWCRRLYKGKTPFLYTYITSLNLHSWLWTCRRRRFACHLMPANQEMTGPLFSLFYKKNKIRLHEASLRTLTYFVWGRITVGTADLLFDWFGFNQASKYVTNSA